jgi:hexosaminidase
MYGELIRSRDVLDYMLFPRLLSLAERAWHKGAWEDIEDDDKRKKAIDDDWLRFARIVGSKELRRLDDRGVKYRISPAGAK